MNNAIRILYVDDEPINLMLFQNMFESNYQVLISESGVEGLKVLEEEKNIQIVISDMKMANMSGLEFIRIAKEKNPHVHFYILSGFEITDEIKDALSQKLIYRYFQKPFNMKEIDTAIKEKLDIE